MIARGPADALVANSKPLKTLQFAHLSVRATLAHPGGRAGGEAVNAASGRWQEIAPSAYPWEREALDFVRSELPDHDPYLAWSNFEFVGQDGSINEIDLLVLSPNGLFLVEIKSRPGEVSGDANTWMWNNDGRVMTTDNPVLLANRKSQRLASLLRAQKAFNQAKPPFVEPAVFLSAPALKVRLDERGRQRVYQRGAGGESRSGIIALFTEPPSAGAGQRPRVDRITARAVAQALQQIGIRPTQASRKVGDFVLEGLLYEGPGYQDWDASHVAAKEIHRRVRLYPVALGTTKLSRRTMERAAQREFQILEGIRHHGILQAVNYTIHERGPALVFEHDRDSIRLDLFLSRRGTQLTLDARLGLLRQIAEALKHAHERHLYHRALSPHSILISDVDAAVPRARIFNWQTGRRDPSTSAAQGAVGTRTTHLGELVEEAARVYMAPEALRSPDSDPAPMDVFSLGALDHVLLRQAPASTAKAHARHLTARARGVALVRLARQREGAERSLRRPRDPCPGGRDDRHAAPPGSLPRHDRRGHARAGGRSPGASRLLRSRPRRVRAQLPRETPRRLRMEPRRGCEGSGDAHRHAVPHVGSPRSPL